MSLGAGEPVTAPEASTAGDAVDADDGDVVEVVPEPQPTRMVAAARATTSLPVMAVLLGSSRVWVRFRTLAPRS
jgi:hypothetical protein